MAVAAHLFDGAAAPPILRRAQNARAWGLRDYFGIPAMELPAGTLARINTMLSYYDAIHSYQGAGAHKANWTKANPHGWELVSYCIAERRKQKSGNR